jgi:transcriptional regulator with XRE-family HTH domain
VATPSKSEKLFRERLKALREQSGLTQGVVSELAGISYDYYKDIEQGVRPNVSLRIIDQIARVYGFSVHELFSPELPRVTINLKPIPTPHYKKRKIASSLKRNY